MGVQLIRHVYDLRTIFVIMCLCERKVATITLGYILYQIKNMLQKVMKYTLYDCDLSAF